jgi:DNA-binding FadR family transcriptional regulator
VRRVRERLTPGQPAAAPDGKTNKANLVIELLRHEIAVGVRPPGSLLPPEGQLTQRLGVSRPSHREALRVLESEGLIKVARGPRGGAKVLMPEVEPVARWVGVYLQMRKAPFEALMEARKTYEPGAAAAIALRRDQAALSALAQCASAQEFSVHDRAVFHQYEFEFTRRLIQYSGNPILQLIGDLLNDVYERGLRTLSRQVPSMDFEVEHLKSGVEGKQRLIRHIANGDAERAERTWKTYISIFEERLFGFVPRDSLIQIYAEDEPPPGPG